jgi:hypothetical protein
MAIYRMNLNARRQQRFDFCRQRFGRAYSPLFVEEWLGTGDGGGDFCAKASLCRLIERRSSVFGSKVSEKCRCVLANCSAVSVVFSILPSG